MVGSVVEVELSPRVDFNLRDTAKISDKIRRREEEGKLFFSFEYFPPKTATGVDNLYERVERMAQVEPLFCDMTWGAGGTTSDLTLDLSGNIQRYLGLDVMMHLTCTNMPQGAVQVALESAKARGIRNILALRGDPPAGQEWKACEDGFAHAEDLVRYIRKHYGDFFSICVACYPEGHPAGFLDGKLTFAEEMAHLKAKVDAGADFLITQMFYDVEEFLEFVGKCREIGITVPILPGILPIQNYAGFKRMTGFCRTKIPPEVAEALDPIKDDDAAVRRFGINLGVDMCRKIIRSGLVPGIHFYSLNLEKSVMAIIEELGLVSRTESIRSLPWRPATWDKRRLETVRPIFWANRPRSYLDRTAEWDEFPNGRWGDSRSPAFGDLSDYHLMGGAGFLSPELKARYMEQLGTISSVEDVTRIFVDFCKGEISRLPWVEGENFAPETKAILGPILWLNQHGLLTINSQPRVNGAPSGDITVGWGGPGGYVYQKAYIEFFCDRAMMERLLEESKKFGSLTILAVRCESSEILSNVKKPRTNAVTWGVFPNQEVIQPTVVDPVSLLAWKQEAFDLWMSAWGNLYPEDSKSREVLKEIQHSYFLVTVVDDDFVAGDIFKIFSAVIKSQ